MNALCTAPSRPVRNPTTRGETCRCVDESFAPTRALRAVWTNPWTTPTRCPPPCPHSRASRPQAPQDQPPVILTGQHRTSLRRGCLHRPFKTTSAPHSNRSQHRPRAGSPPILQAHFRMGLDWMPSFGLGSFPGSACDTRPTTRATHGKPRYRRAARQLSCQLSEHLGKYALQRGIPAGSDGRTPADTASKCRLTALS